MPPPWKECPKIPLGSAGWRMGYGEDYWYRWQDWFMSLSETERREFSVQFPEPPGWEGFYARTPLHFSMRTR